VWAGQWTATNGVVGYGWLYRIAAEEAVLEPDADLLSLPGQSFQAPAAIVISVYERAVAPDQPRFARKLQQVLAAHERARRHS
jgi:hypothetical protein